MTRKRKGQTKINEPANERQPNSNIVQAACTDDKKECKETSKPLTDNLSTINTEPTSMIKKEDSEIQKPKRTHRGRRKHKNQENSTLNCIDNNSGEVKNDNIQKAAPKKPTEKVINAQNNQSKSVSSKESSCAQVPKSTQNNPKSTQNNPKSTQSNPTSTQNNPKSPVNLAQLLQQNLALPPLNPEEDDDEEMEDCIEYKFKPRPVFLANACNYCKRVELEDDVKLKPCAQCNMVSYCGEGHRKYDVSHPQFCPIICGLRHSIGAQHIYQDTKGLNMEDFRQMRIQIMMMCQNSSGRLLEPNEREILLFPRLCNNAQCREWRTEKLTNCPNCQQVSYCMDNPKHLSKDHASWCKSFKLFHQIAARIFKYGTIEPELPEKIFAEKYALTKNINDFFRDIYEDACDVYDECDMAVVSLMATAPLSTLYAMQKINKGNFTDSLKIHVVGAELQFEADTLNKWESFFLHLVPEIKNIKIVFVGPELNVEDLPVDELSKIGLCKDCQSAKRVINFEFQCKKLYHDYAASGQFSTPDIVCAFNAGLHRVAGYAGQDTWPKTIAAIMKSNVPFIITAYTEHEAPLDLKRIHESAGRSVEVLVKPHINPYASLKPDRNFISEESAPFIFKNFYITVVK